MGTDGRPRFSFYLYYFTFFFFFLHLLDSCFASRVVWAGRNHGQMFEKSSIYSFYNMLPLLSMPSMCLGI